MDTLLQERLLVYAIAGDMTIERRDRQAGRESYVSIRRREQLLNDWLCDIARRRARPSIAMKIATLLCVVLLMLPLTSFAPVPAPRTQECSEQIAHQTGAPYLREVILNSHGIPYGEVAAWSCSGDVAATIAEFNRRKAEMIESAR